MDERDESQQAAESESLPDVELTRKERRMKGKQPQQNFGATSSRGTSAVVPNRRQYSSRRSG